MAKLTVKAGTTSRSEYVFIQNSTSTTGGGLTGLVYNSAGLTAYYVTERGTPTAITLVTLASATTAYSSSGFIAVDGTNMPGLYRIDIPSAVLAGNKGIVYLKGATNMVPCVLEYDVVAYDPQDTVRLGLTSIPNVASGSAGAIITSGTGTAQLSTTSGLVTAGTVNDKTGYSLSGGGGGGSTTTVRMGPFSFSTPDTRSGESISTMVGSAHDIEFQLRDASGTEVATTGATVTAKVYSLAGTLVDTYTATAIYATGGRGYFTLDSTVTGTAGTYRVTLTRTTGATDTSVFGPVTLYVREV